MLQRFVDPAAIAGADQALQAMHCGGAALFARPVPEHLTPDLLWRMSASVPGFVRSRHDRAGANEQEDCSFSARLRVQTERQCARQRPDPDRATPLPPPAPAGLRGVAVVQARWCAATMRGAEKWPRPKG
jgi:hypothetical protein